ncbi:MAG: TatD family hydrolase [Burkholderiales bacterium]|nr:MAG: TatD family hydrolase [Burkholderiales bacterium]
MARLIDTHCHLDAGEFDPDRAQVLARARAAGVAALLVPAVERANFATVRALAGQQPGIAYTLGIHPLYLERAAPGDVDLLRDAARAAMDDSRFVGIGEIGLDHFVTGLDPQRQLQLFVAQLEIAARLALPVVLHVRRAQDVMLRELRRVRVPGGIAHAFNGSRQQAQAFLDLGFALGFGGAMTFERASRIRALVAELDAGAHVLETDAPDIPPQWIRNGRNSPEELPRIARSFAALRGLELDAALAQTEANALRVLPRMRTALGD